MRDARADAVLSISYHLYRALLFSYPSEFRQQYGLEMSLAFRDRCRNARRRNGLPGIIALWLKTILDLAITAPGEHMEILWQDLRYGLRMLGSNLGFTFIAVMTLALGIGANTAIFSVVNSVLLRPLPYPQSEQLMNLSETNLQRNVQQAGVAPATYLDWKTQSKSFSDIGAYGITILSYTAHDGAVRLTGARFTASMFSVLGVKPIAGRTITTDEEQPGKSDVVVLSEQVWEKHFGRDQTVIGRVIQLNTHPYTVVGVMPKSLVFPIGAADLRVPLTFDNTTLQSRAPRILNVVRTASGWSLGCKSQF